MSTYKAGQDWQRNQNENMWLPLKVQELEAYVAQLENTIEELHQEMRDMQHTAEYEEPDTLDAEIIDAEIVEEGMWHAPNGEEY